MKKKFWGKRIILWAFFLVVIAILACFLWGNDGENTQDWHELPFYVPSSGWGLVFNEPREFFALWEAGFYEDEEMFDYFLDISQRANQGTLGFEHALAFASDLGMVYLPVGKEDWVFADYSNNVMLNLSFQNDINFLMAIITNAEFSKHSLAYAKEMGEDITDVLLAYKVDDGRENLQHSEGMRNQIENVYESFLRVGAGIRVYQTSPFDAYDTDNVARFFLDVNGQYVALFFYNVEREEQIFSVLANLVFGRHGEKYVSRNSSGV